MADRGKPEGKPRENRGKSMAVPLLGGYVHGA